MWLKVKSWRMKRTFNVKCKAFSFSFKGLSIAKKLCQSSSPFRKFSTSMWLTILLGVQWRVMCIFLFLKLYNFIKASLCYFLSVLFFSTKWESFKKYEKCFLFHLKSSFRSRDIQIFVFFSLPFHTLQIQKEKWKWNNLWCHELTCINLQM